MNGAVALGKLKPTERIVLHAMYQVGSCGRKELARTVELDPQTVSYALTGLANVALVDRPEQGTTIWRITDAGSKLIGSSALLAAPTEADEESDSGQRPVDSGDADPAPVGSLRQKLGEEIERIAKRRAPAPTFSEADAAWLCDALAEQFGDMPNIAAMLRLMADYWTKQGSAEV